MDRYQAQDLANYVFSYPDNAKESLDMFKLLLVLEKCWGTPVERTELYRLGFSKDELDNLLKPLLDCSAIDQLQIVDNIDTRKNGKPRVLTAYVRLI